MVFFTCNACGESLKKVQVEKHVNMCRGCEVLSCIDCGKDFWGNDYRNHLKCITEDQKYGGKGFEAKSNKGEVKQQQWIQRIHDAMNKPGVSQKMKDILSQVSSYDNVPRKKAKFQNWMKNSLRMTNPNLQDEVWEIFSAATTNGAEASKLNTTAEDTPAEVKVQNESEELAPKEEKKKLNKRERKEARQQKNGKTKKGAENAPAVEHGEKVKKRKHASEEANGDETSTKKRKKSKDCSEDDQDESQSADEVEEREASKGKFNWKGTIKAVIRQSTDQEISVKKLKKKVLAAYYTFSGESNFKSEEQLMALFNKKIKGNPKFKVLKDKVKLVN
ncbi:cell growth-regulating nucleolar protein [Gadus macrocephalus]|uniref:cell growth-regulating nucleolar protein n=1 Tax=Gadus macrocephalus TaxID=80720 RepID=UPI0028CB31D4|nr:cell growth-regulating nucleolar protein [Gadus macrocephalus]